MRERERERERERGCRSDRAPDALVVDLMRSTRESERERICV